MKDQVAGTATLSRRGQISIPKGIRDARFLKEGAEMEFREDGDLILHPSRPTEDPLNKWFGKYPLPPEEGDVDVVTWAGCAVGRTGRSICDRHARQQSHRWGLAWI